MVYRFTTLFIILTSFISISLNAQSYNVLEWDTAFKLTLENTETGEIERYYTSMRDDIYPDGVCTHDGHSPEDHNNSLYISDVYGNPLGEYNDFLYKTEFTGDLDTKHNVAWIWSKTPINYNSFEITTQEVHYVHLIDKNNGFIHYEVIDHVIIYDKSKVIRQYTLKGEMKYFKEI